MHAKIQSETADDLSRGAKKATQRALLRAAMRVEIENIIQLRLCVSPEHIHGSVRGPSRVVFARQLALYLLQINAGLTAAEAAIAFGRDRTTAANALRAIEARREADASIDLAITLIEADVKRALAHVEARCRLGH